MPNEPVDSCGLSSINIQAFLSDTLRTELALMDVGDDVPPHGFL